jgi:hypothetical protein
VKIGRVIGNNSTKEPNVGHVTREANERRECWQGRWCGLCRQSRVVVNRGKEPGTVALSLRHRPARRSIRTFGHPGTALAHGPRRHRLGRQRCRRQGRGWWGYGGDRAARRGRGRRDNGRATPVTAAARQGNQGDRNDQLTKRHTNLLCLRDGRRGHGKWLVTGAEKLHSKCLPAEKPTAGMARIPRAEQALSVR